MVDGTGGTAKFYSPSGVAVDASGQVYVADYDNHLISKISPAGVVSTFAGVGGTAGSANGTGATATFHSPSGVAIDTGGNLYVADYSNHLIRKISPAGVVSTLAGMANGSGYMDGTSGTAQFNYPYGLAVDSNGSVYVADFISNRIRQISPAGVVSTLAGTGASGADNGLVGVATFNNPTGVAVDTSGHVFVADYSNHLIREITLP